MNNLSDIKTAEILADLLANYHDWDCADPRAEFLAVAADSQTKVSLEDLEKLFDQFEKLPGSLRFRPGFDHLGFVRDTIPS